MGSERFLLRLVIYLLLLTTFCLGWPSFHYAVALMVAILIRHRNDPAALFRPIEAYPLPRIGPRLARVRANHLKR